MNVKHTPGPWNDGMDANGNPLIFQRRNDPWLAFADVNEEWQANLQLVDAAPDLLEALKAIVKSLADQDDEGLIEHAQQMIDARAAITKATGCAA